MLTPADIANSALRMLSENPFRLTEAQLAENRKRMESVECQWCMDNGCWECSGGRAPLFLSDRGGMEALAKKVYGEMLRESP